MRLIDADALLDEVCEDLGEGEVLYSIPPSYIDDAPTVDAVEVVRCKDCKWFDPVRQECCGNVVTDNEGGSDFTINFEENDFCSFGERRTDEKV